MRIEDFSDQEFIDCLNLLAAPYKKKNSIESLSPIEIKELQRTDFSVSIITSQLFANKYLLDRVYKFSNNEEDKIKIEIIEADQNEMIATDLSDRVRPFLAMISKDDELKGKDWLSRLNYNDYLLLINKYYNKKCASLTFENTEQSPEHCRWISLNDENGYYMDTVVFGDYGIGYNHYGKLSKTDNQGVFDNKSLELYYTIVNKLNNLDKVEYTKQFIQANMLAYQTSNSTKDYYEQEMKKAEEIAQKLINDVAQKTVNKAVNKATSTETKNHHSKFAPSSQGVKSRKAIEDDFELTM